MKARRANRETKDNHVGNRRSDRLVKKKSLPNKKMVSIIIKDHVIRYIDAKKPSLRGITAIGEHYLPPDIITDGKIMDVERLRSILRSCVQKWGIVNREVQFLVPDSFVIVRKLDIPSNVEDEAIKGYLYLELGSKIHLPFDNPIFDIDFLEQTEDKKEILLFAAPENVVTEYEQVLKSVGLKSTAADVSSLAIYRLFIKASDEMDMVIPEGPLTLSIQFDLQSVTVSVIHHHKLLLIRQFKMNLAIDSWERQEGKYGTLTPEWGGDEGHLKYEINVMMGEIERVISYYRSLINHSDAEIDMIILTGDYPYLNDIANQIQQSFGKDPFMFSQDLFDTQSKELIPHRYYLPLGLSLKGGV